jgi:FlaA1/EpsC-like NDP-sugar epimerase
MERYFMTIPEAVHLVLQAAAMGRGGEAFLLDMGEQVRIVDLAQDLIRLSGLEPGRDIEIEFTGIRPGEKMREELWEDQKVYEKTTHPDIRRSVHEELVAGGDLPAVLDDLERLAEQGDAPGILDRLQESIPGATISEAPSPDITAIF